MPSIEPEQMADGHLAAASLAKAGFAGEDLVIAVAVAYAESGWNPHAVGGPNSNGSYDYGLMQINDVHKPSQLQRTDRDANAVMAYSIWMDAGNKWTPWSTFNSGRYLESMDTARNIVNGGDFSFPSLPNPLDGISSALAPVIGFLSSALVAILALGTIALGIYLIAKPQIDQAAAKAVRMVVTKGK